MQNPLRLNALLISIALMPAAVRAQSELPKLENLKVPNSPAFTLLGISPTSVERPTSARALGMTLVTAVEDGGALEVAPYWWTDHPLTIEGYYNSGMWDTFLQTAAISAALTDLPEDAAGNRPAGNRVGVGVRFELMRGGRPPALMQHVKEIQDLNADQAADDDVTADEAKSYEQRRAAAVEKYKTADAQPIGWTLAVGGGVVVDSPDGQGSDVSRSGAWITPAYTGLGEDLSTNITFVGVGRYYNDDLPSEPDDKVDLGGRLIWTVPDSPVTLSVEGLHRFQPFDDDERFSAMIDYQVSQDMSFYFSYGTDFNSAFEGSDDIIALFGMNLGVGRGPRGKTE